MKKIIALCLALILCLGMFTACGAEKGKSDDKTDDSKVYRLSVSFHDSAQALKTQYVQKWADAVKEASNGRLDITVYAGGTIAGAADALDAVKQQTCDIAVCFSGFFPGQFPLSEVITMPLAGMDNAVQATNVLWDLMDESPEMQKEYEDYKVVMLYAGPNNIICSSKEVNTVEDLKGLKLRAPAGTATGMCTNWGASPMNISSAELYQSMEKEVINGYIIDMTGVEAWQLYEVTKSYLNLPFYTQSWAVLMNKDSYNALPADLQKIIDEYSGRDWSVGFGELNEEEAEAAYKTATEKYASKIVTPTGDALDSFKPACEEYISKWIESISANGFDGQAFYDKALELAAKHDK